MAAFGELKTPELWYRALAAEELSNGALVEADRGPVLTRP
jgi:hypothetical protein